MTNGLCCRYYKGHPNDFPVDVDTLKAEMFITPVSRPVSAASQRAASAKSTKSKPSCESIAIFCLICGLTVMQIYYMLTQKVITAYQGKLSVLQN